MSFRCLSDQRLRPLRFFQVFIIVVSDACQIKDLDHDTDERERGQKVSDACQIKDLDH